MSNSPKSLPYEYVLAAGKRAIGSPDGYQRTPETPEALTKPLSQPTFTRITNPQNCTPQHMFQNTPNILKIMFPPPMNRENASLIIRIDDKDSRCVITGHKE
uniref:SFRICE_016885 n=1 Tax=Spodoptera frugiperda TaxID=7108 RepID=A0A2H1VGM2_SPOFR